MTEAVTDIIVSRSRRSDGLKAMAVWSVGIHVAVVAGLMAMPETRTEEAPRTVMTISLGGPPGPKTDGLNAMGDRSVQAVAKDVARLETPPAPERPVMALPSPRRITRPERPRPTQAPAESTARALSTGEEVRDGSTRTATRTRGTGFGLATAGGFGGSMTVDAPNFCCQEYLAEIRDLIQRNYSPNQDVTGMTRMMFTIQRNGLMTDIKLERSSGISKLDRASERTLMLTPSLPPLPVPYTNQTLTVHLDFEYKR